MTGWTLDEESAAALDHAVVAGNAAREQLWRAGLHALQTPAQAALETLESLGYTLTRKDTTAVDAARTAGEKAGHIAAAKAVTAYAYATPRPLEHTGCARAALGPHRYDR